MALEGTTEAMFWPSDMLFLDVKGLSRYLNIKPSTLYAWVAQGRIPALKIHGLVRFRRQDIDQWVEGFRSEAALPCLASINLSRPSSRLSIDQRTATSSLASSTSYASDALDRMIARAKEQAYNLRHGETRPKPSPKRREGA